jgi:lipopolysaccharide biosynthesis glycosyltransferase
MHETYMDTPYEPHQTTPFAFTRFLTPSYWGKTGFSVFMDPDMLCLCDIKQLYDLFDPQYAVQVVKHKYTPRAASKYVGGIEKEQTAYDRKNWSSLIIFNNRMCNEIYTRESLHSHSGLTLNTFRNIPDSMIGSIPKEFNYLVGEDNQIGPAKIVHFTNGSPLAPNMADCEYSTEWNNELTQALQYGPSH